MNWDIVRDQGTQKAHAFAIQGGAIAVGTPRYSDRYNAYFQGFLECAAERESLRCILRRHEKESVKDSEPNTDKTPTLDDLV